MPSIEPDNPETEEEEMEQDSPDGDNSSEDDSDDSEEESELELDEEECSKRRNECLDDMTELERQFSEIREQLYKERIHQIENKLEEVAAGRAVEYLDPLHQLQEQMQIRTKVAGILREYRVQSLLWKSEAEELAANQHMQSEKMLLFDSIKGELEDKIRRLEEDRHNIDISSDLWNETHSNKKNKKKSNDPMNPDRRRKPITVTGPYIVYMLKDVDIIEDWTTIKKANRADPDQTAPVGSGFFSSPEHNMLKALKQQSQKKRSEYKELMMR